MPTVRANISFFLQIENFKNVDLFQRGYYQFRYYFKSGNSHTQVTNYAKSTVAIYPPVLQNKYSNADVTTSYVQEGQLTQPLSPTKGCSKTVLIMYHKEKGKLRDMFEQQVQVNLDATQLEDIFKSTELYLCTELWFTEETNGTILQPASFTCVCTRQFRVSLSPTRGLCHHFIVMFDYTHLCAVECIIYGFLTGILPGLTKVSVSSSGLSTLAMYESFAAQNWKQVLFSTSNVANRHYVAVAVHRHLCQALLSARERMLTFWHDISIFLSSSHQPKFDLMNLRSELDKITNRFQSLSSDLQIEERMGEDLEELGAENLLLFRKICKFAVSTSKVVKHLQRKSHQIRMKRFAESFFVQELSLSHLLAVYDPSSVGHESTASTVRQSQYFQHLPTLPVSCKDMDGDSSNMPIIFEDVYICNTDMDQQEMVVMEKEKEEQILKSTTSIVDGSSENSFSSDVILLRKSHLNDSGFNQPDDVSRDNTPEIVTIDDCMTDSNGISTVPNCFLPTNITQKDGSLDRPPGNSENDVARSAAYLRVTRRPSTHRIHRNRLLGRRFRHGSRCSLEPVLPSMESQIHLMSYRRFGDESFSGVSLGPHFEVGKMQPSLYSPIVNISDHRSSSLMSLSSIDTDINLFRNRVDRFRKMRWSKLKPAQSTPNLQAGLGTLNNQSMTQHGLENNTLILEDVAKCKRCGLPNWSLHRSRQQALKPTFSNSMPTLTVFDMPDFDAVNLADSEQVKNRYWGRPSLRKLKSRHQTRQRSDPKHKRNTSQHIYSEDLVRLGSCRDLREGGSDVCHCDRSPGEYSRTPFIASTALLPPAKVRHSFTEDTLSLNIEKTCTTRIPTGTGCRSVSPKPRRKGCKIQGNSRSSPSKAVVIFSEQPQDGGAARVMADEQSIQPQVSRMMLGNEWTLNKSNQNASFSLEKSKLPQRSLSSNFVDTLAANYDVSTHLNEATSRTETGRNSADEAEPANNSMMSVSRSHDLLVNTFAPGTMTFVVLKEEMKKELMPGFQGNVYSDFSRLAVPYPYFTNPPFHSTDTHLIVCVHGLDGNCMDLRLVVVYLQLALPDCPLEFLMSDSNHDDTFASLDQLRDNLVDEILQHISSMESKPTHISFIGHSLGCVLIRGALAHTLMEPFLPLLHCFLSLCGPHLGTVYGTSGLVNVGMWALQKLKKSHSLLQLRLRDNSDPRETYLYRLSSADGLNRFRYVLLVSSPQDHYVPHHSSRIELCRAAVQDVTETGKVYMEMVTNMLQRLIKESRTTVVRYDINHAFQSGANHFIGRAAHISVLDSELLLEKFFCVSAAKYFRCDEKQIESVQENLI